MRDYEVSIAALSQQGQAIAGLAPDAEAIEQAVRSATLPPEPVTIAAELATFRDTWSDALNAVGLALGALGGNLRSASAGYAGAEAQAFQRYDRAERRIGGI